MISSIEAVLERPERSSSFITILQLFLNSLENRYFYATLLSTIAFDVIFV